jgi:HlyD family secretion protein
MVWILRDAAPVAVPIKVGVTDGTVTEVAEGDLKDGDDVITEAPNEAGAASGQARPPGLRF